MNTLIVKINFSTLSQGEQIEVYRIVKKAQLCQPVSDKEQKFIADMASRGEKSNPDQLDKAWASLVAHIGINAGAYLNAKLEKAFTDSAIPGSEVIFSILQTALTQMIKPFGGCVDNIEMVFLAEGPGRLAYKIEEE